MRPPLTIDFAPIFYEGTRWLTGGPMFVWSNVHVLFEWYLDTPSMFM